MPVVGIAQRRVEPAREAEEEGERVLGQVDADLALLARQDHVAPDELRREDAVDAGAEGVVVAEPALAREDVGRHAAEQHVGVGDLGALVGQVARLDEDGGRAGRLQDPRTLLGAKRGNAQGGRVEDLHSAP